MITEYEVRVVRPWGPGIKKGDIINVSARRKVQLVRGRFAEVVEKPAEEKPVVEKPIRKKAKKKY